MTLRFSGKGIDFGGRLDYTYSTFRQSPGMITAGEIIMEWTAPVFEEVCLNCEINSYASAKL